MTYPHQMPIQPEPLPQPKSAKRWPWIVGIIGAFFFGIAIGAASASSGTGDTKNVASPESTTPTASEVTTPDAEPTTVITPEPEPNPDVEFRFGCDYLLGDFTENSKNGYRFVGDAIADNVGNVGAIVRFKTVWYLAGGEEVTQTKKVKVPYNSEKRVGFKLPTTGDKIDAHQSYSGSKTCTVDATIVDTFGQAH